MADNPPSDDRTLDAFLGGRVMALQPRKGYRAGTDPVFLASAVVAEAGQTVLELGCGAGIAAMCLAERVPGLAIVGVEIQPDYAALARENGVDAVRADLADLPPELRQRQFDHVMMNPPFFDRAHGLPSPHDARDLAFGGGPPLPVWIDVAARRLAPGGHLTMIAKTARLPEILGALSGRLGSIRIRPLAAREGRDPDRVVLRARKDGRGAFRLLCPLVLHDGAAHSGDRDDFTAEVRELLRCGAPFPWGD